MPKVLVEFNSIEEAVQALSHGAATVMPSGNLAGYSPAPVPAPAAETFVPAAPQAYAAPAPVAPAPVAPAPAAPAPVAAPAAQAHTLGSVAQLVQAYAGKHGARAAKALLSEFGATAIKDIPEAQYPALVARLSV